MASSTQSLEVFECPKYNSKRWINTRMSRISTRTNGKITNDGTHAALHGKRKMSGK
jgi:hypothetical protein